MFLSRRGFNNSDSIGRGKGFFQPNFQQPLKAVALDVLVLVMLGFLSEVSCLCFLPFSLRNQLALRARAFYRFAGVRRG